MKRPLGNKSLGCDQDGCVDRYLDGAMGPAERRDLEARAAANAELRDELAEFRALDETARSALRDELAPATAGWSAEAASSIETASSIKAGREPRRTGRTIRWVGAAAVGLVAMAVAVDWNGHPDPTRPIAGPQGDPSPQGGMQAADGSVAPVDSSTDSSDGTGDRFVRRIDPAEFWGLEASMVDDLRREPVSVYWTRAGAETDRRTDREVIGLVDDDSNALYLIRVDRESVVVEPIRYDL